MGIFKWLRKPKYDLETIEGIQAIKIPKYHGQHYGSTPTKNIEYILQRKATEHKRNKRMDLAIACLKKSNEIMPHSNWAWPKSNYLRLVEFLKQDGQFDKAREEQKKIDEMFKDSLMSSINLFQEILDDAKSIGTDLLEMDEHYPTCAECAKYQGRVFSISGKDKRFPRLPEQILKTGELHEGCRHTFFPFIYGASKSAYGHRDIAKYSNRPFTDNRSKAEKAEWEHEEHEAKEYEKDKTDFDWIREHLSNMAPKSFGGYRRMKSSKSKNYAKIVAAAKEKKREI